MRDFGLIGFPLGHSFSKPYFDAKFQREGITNARFHNFPISDISQFPELLEQHPNLQGLAVTIPYKEAVLPYLEQVDSNAAAIGAVNCLHRQGQHWIGFNTDWIGFRQSLQPFLAPHHQRALIFGTGGSSKAVQYALTQLGISYQLVSRQPGPNQWSYAELPEKNLHAYLLWINCTPIGTWPNIHETLPLPLSQLTPQHYLFDLVYNPPETAFLQAAKVAGACAKNGQDMLAIQAEANWRIWQGN